MDSANTMNPRFSPLSPGPVPPPPGRQLAPDCRTVLVVDDVDVTRQRIRRILTAQGHQVIEASNGRRALQLLSGPATVDAIVLDLVMPQMNGWDFRHTQLSDAHL